MVQLSLIFVALAAVLTVQASPISRTIDCQDVGGNQQCNSASVSNRAEGASSFQLQNGKDAQALNKQFETLTPDSTCTAGQTACVNGSLAQCVNSKFVITSCSAPLSCIALPLVNKPGTSITCTTQADALARIQATGAPGGISG